MLKIHTIVAKLLCLCFCLIQVPSKAQDTLFFNRDFEPVASMVHAKFMQLINCAPDNPNKCAVATFLLDSNQIIANQRYIDYPNKVLQGRCQRWYYNGALLEETLYEQGKKQGTEKVYHINGQLIRQLIWEKDSLVSATLLNPDGSPQKNIFREDLEITYAQEMPSFKEGQEGMYKFLNQTVIYPEAAKENGIQGLVLLSFVIERKGEIVEIKVLESPNESLTNALLSAVKKMPAWNPGRLDGRPIRVRYQLPFRFVLE